MTIEELVDKLYATIRAHVNYDNEFDLPRMELHYRPSFGWELFMTDGNERCAHPDLFYKVHTSPEKALLENIAYFEKFEKLK